MAGMVVPVSTTKAESLMPRSRMSGLVAASVAYRERWTLAASRRDSSIFSCSPPAVSETGVSLANVPSSRRSTSRDPGAENRFV